MKKRAIWIAVSVLLVLGLVAGACTKPSVTTTPSGPAASPAPTASPSPTASPIPSPKPTTTVAPTTAPTPAQTEAIKWIQQLSYADSPSVPDRFKGFGYYGTATSGRSLADHLKKLTNGRLVVETVAAGAVVPVGQEFDGVKSGAIDGAWHAFAAGWTGKMPEAFVEVGMTYAWQNANELWDGNVNYGLHDIVKEAYAEQGIHINHGSNDNLYTWYTNFEPTTPWTFKGKKFRAWGMNGELVNALGGTAVAVPGTETYMAMKLGTVDAILYDSCQGEIQKLHEVTKYVVTNLNCSPTGLSYLTNLKRVQALPADIRLIFDTVVEPWNFYWSRYYAAADQWALQRLIKNGTWKGYEWSDADITKLRKEYALPLWDKVAEKSPRAKKAVDAIKQQMRDLGRI